MQNSFNGIFSRSVILESAKFSLLKVKLQPLLARQVTFHQSYVKDEPMIKRVTFGAWAVFCTKCALYKELFKPHHCRPWSSRLCEAGFILYLHTSALLSRVILPPLKCIKMQMEKKTIALLHFVLRSTKSFLSHFSPHYSTDFL